MSLARLGRLLELDRPIPGERTTWTVRTEHGVHTVELEQAVTGTSVPHARARSSPGSSCWHW